MESFSSVTSPMQNPDGGGALQPDGVSTGRASLPGATGPMESKQCLLVTPKIDVVERVELIPANFRLSGITPISIYPMKITLVPLSFSALLLWRF